MQEFNPSSEHLQIRDSIIKAGKIALKWFKNDPENWEKEDGSLISKVDIEINNLLGRILKKVIQTLAGYLKKVKIINLGLKKKLLLLLIRSMEQKLFWKEKKNFQFQ